MTQSVKVSGEWKTVDKTFVRVASPLYVCPVGYTEVGGLCRAVAPYTYTNLEKEYSEQTETSPYTYYRGQVGTTQVWSTCSSATTGPNGEWIWIEQPHPCLVTVPVYGDIKNPPPDGWIDNGTEYERTVIALTPPPEGFYNAGDVWESKDAPPNGWIDDGSQYVSIVNKVPQENADGSPCPSGYIETEGVCREVSPYTYTTLPYTYSTSTITSPYTYTQVMVSPGGVANQFYTDVPSCPPGYNTEFYNWTWACTLYYAPTYRQDKNPPPSGWTDNGTAYETTITVKDTPPEGFTDNGTLWISKDSPPSGWYDDGTQYVSTLNEVPSLNAGDELVWKEVTATFVRVNGVWETLSVPVPDLSGLTTAQADAALTAGQLTRGTVSSGFTSNPAFDDKVGDQTIAPGTLVVPGTAVGYTFTTFKATPPRPTLSYYGTTGRFRIDNYNSSYVYTISAGTRSGSILILPGANTSATIKAQSFAGGDYSPEATYAQKSASYTPDTRYSYPCGTACDTCQYCGCECAGGGCGCYGAASQSWGQCGCPGTMCWYGSYSCNCRTTYCSGGSAPSLISEPGYTWTGSEWYKITY